MNAILVFDPSNDLLFVKSNQLYRSKLLKYARANGLLPSHSSASGGRARRRHTFASSGSVDAEATSGAHQQVTSCSSTSSSGESINSPAARQQTEISNDARSSATSGWGGDLNNPHKNKKKLESRGPQQAAAGAHLRARRRDTRPRRAPDRLRRTAAFDDTSKCYLDVLMLLLTPYVASLRLSQSLRRQTAHELAELATAGQHRKTTGSSGPPNDHLQQSTGANVDSKPASGSSLFGGWWPASSAGKSSLAGGSHGQAAGGRSVEGAREAFEEEGEAEIGEQKEEESGRRRSGSGGSNRLLEQLAAAEKQRALGQAGVVGDAAPQEAADRSDDAQAQGGGPDAELLAKFMNSISINHECGLGSGQAPATTFTNNGRHTERHEFAGPRLAGNKSSARSLASSNSGGARNCGASASSRTRADAWPQNTAAADANTTADRGQWWLRGASGSGDEEEKIDPIGVDVSGTLATGADDEAAEHHRPTPRRANKHNKTLTTRQAGVSARAEQPAGLVADDGDQDRADDDDDPPSDRSSAAASSLLLRHHNQVNFGEGGQHSEAPSTTRALLEHLREYEQDSSRVPAGTHSATGAGHRAHSISTLAVPVDCLQDCQVVYCELYDFIFIYMQQLDETSSFKMRLLQKRIDVFARLTLLLFGQCLNSLRATGGGELRAHQSHVLRRLYDCWFEHQFEPEFFLEANERLIVGSHIGQLCRATLRDISIVLRRDETATQQQVAAAGNLQQPLEEQNLALQLARLQSLESHQHALLFSDLKLVSRFSCLNSSAPLAQDDLILLMVLLKAYNADHENELTGGDSDDSQPPAAAVKNRLMYKSHFRTDRHTCQIRASHADAPAATPPPATRKLPHQFPIFLSGHASRRCPPLDSSVDQIFSGGGGGGGNRSSPLEHRTLVPHMVRFVSLTRGITLILISELADSAYLAGQLGRVHKILLDFGKAAALAAGAAAAAAPCAQGHASADGRRDCAPAAQSPKVSPGGLLKLSQLAKVNDCIGAIRSYFQRLDLVELQRVSLARARAARHAEREGARIASSSLWPSQRQHNCDDSDEPQSDSEFRSRQPPPLLDSCEEFGARDNSRRSSSASTLLLNLVGKFLPAAATDKRQRDEDHQRDCDHLRPCDNLGQQRRPASRNVSIDRHEDNSARRAAQGRTGGGGGGGLAASASGGRKEPTTTRARRVFEMLEADQRRLCRHLLRKLGELAQSNIQTYMRQTFGLATDQHKREALLGSVCSVVRDALSSFVLEPALARLHAHHSNESTGGAADLSSAYLRYASERVDRVRLLARTELSDYLDYLAVKSGCNVTLGAPFTHDLQSIGSFIYLDRARQELVQSPIRRTVKLSWRELVEGNFQGAIERHRRAQAAHSSGASSSSGGSSSSSDYDRASPSSHLSSEDADQSDGSSSSSDTRSLLSRAGGGDGGEAERCGTGLRPPRRQVAPGRITPSVRASETSRSTESVARVHNRRPGTPAPLELASKLYARTEATRSAKLAKRTRQFLGTSQDVLSAATASSNSSMATSSRHSLLPGGLSLAGSGASMSPQPATVGDTDGNHPKQEELIMAHTGGGNLMDATGGGGLAKPVDENTLKGFSAFIYNRLAQGQTSSFTQNDAKLDPRRRAATALSSRRNFRSLPNVICDDFFSRLTRALVAPPGPAPSVRHPSPATPTPGQTRPRSARRKRHVKVYCQLRELDPTTGRNLSRRQLTRVREEEEEEEDDDQDDDDDDLRCRRRLEFEFVDDGAPPTAAVSCSNLSELRAERENEDFGAFLSGQRRSSRQESAHRKARGKSDQSKFGASAPSRAANEQTNAWNCCELFLVHDSNLLVHRDQLTVEAQLLARRLARFTSADSHQTQPGDTFNN